MTRKDQLMQLAIPVAAIEFRAEARESVPLEFRATVRFRDTKIGQLTWMDVAVTGVLVPFAFDEKQRIVAAEPLLTVFAVTSYTRVYVVRMPDAVRVAYKAAAVEAVRSTLAEYPRLLQDTYNSALERERAVLTRAVSEATRALSQFDARPMLRPR